MKNKKSDSKTKKTESVNQAQINNMDLDEPVTDIKGTIVGFVAPDKAEKTQEEEIQDFKLKKQSERELSKLSEEEQKRRRKEYKEEEERLEEVKTELIKSIRERIPVIEKKFMKELSPTKKENVVEKVKNNSRQKMIQNEKISQQKPKVEEKERDE